MRTFVALAFPALLAIFMGPAFCEANPFVESFRRGLDAEESGNFDDAITLYSQALKHTNSAQILAKRAEAYLRKNDPQAAIRDLKESIRLDPGFAAAYVRLGFAHNALNEYDNAVEALNTAVELDPASSEALNTRGFAFNGKNDYESAIRDFDKAVRIKPNDSRYHNNRGFALNGRHRYDEAIQDFDKAIELDSTKSMFYNNRGTAYLRKKQYDKALEDFDAALKLDSQFSSAYHNRGMALSGKGRHDRAVEEFSKVIELNPSSALLYKDRGTAYFKMGDYEQARRDFEKALELDKKFAQAYAALALMYATAQDNAVKNPAHALRNAEKAAALTKGESPDLMRSLAEVYYAVNRPQEALNFIKKAVEGDPNNTEYRELFAKWQSDSLGAPPEARDSSALRNLW